MSTPTIDTDNLYLPGRVPIARSFLRRVTHVTETYSDCSSCSSSTVRLQTLTEERTLPVLDLKDRAYLYSIMDQERQRHPTRTTDYVVSKKFSATSKKRKLSPETPAPATPAKKAKTPEPAAFIIKNTTHSVLVPFSTVASLFWRKEDHELTVLLTGSTTNVTAQMSESEYNNLQNRFLKYHTPTVNNNQ